MEEYTGDLLFEDKSFAPNGSSLYTNIGEIDNQAAWKRIKWFRCSEIFANKGEKIEVFQEY